MCVCVCMHVCVYSLSPFLAALAAKESEDERPPHERPRPQEPEVSKEEGDKDPPKGNEGAELPDPKANQL